MTRTYRTAHEEGLALARRKRVLSWQDYCREHLEHGEAGEPELIVVRDEGAYTLWWLCSEDVPLPASADAFRAEADAQKAAEGITWGRRA
jgi:hypothetical protein